MQRDNNQGTETFPTYSLSDASKDRKQSDTLAIPRRSDYASWDAQSRSPSTDGSRSSRGSRSGSGAWGRPGMSATERWINEENEKKNKHQSIMAKLFTTKFAPPFLK